MGVGQVLDMDRVAKHQLGEGLIPENRVPLALKNVQVVQTNLEHILDHSSKCVSGKILKTEETE